MTSGDSAETTATTAQWGAKNEVGSFLVLGLLLLIVGAAVMAAAWPGTEASGDLFGTPSLKETGSTAWTMIGAAVALAGQLLTLVSVIAIGVRLGNRP